MAVGITAVGLTAHIRGTLVFAASESPVDFDLSLFVMVALFVILMILFNGVLYRPYLRAREVRDDRIDGAKKDARQMQKKAEVIFAQYEDKLSTALREASSQRHQVREEAKGEEAKIIEAARAEMDAVVRAAQADLDAELERARAELDEQARELSTIIVDRVLA